MDVVKIKIYKGLLFNYYMNLKQELLQLLDTDPYLNAPHHIESDLAINLREIYNKSDKNEFIKSIYEVFLENLDKNWRAFHIALEVLDDLNIDDKDSFVKFLTDIILKCDDLGMSWDQDASTYLRPRVSLKYMRDLCNKLSTGPIQNDISYQYIMRDAIKTYGNLNNTNDYPYMVYSALCRSRPESLMRIKEDIMEAVDIADTNRINQLINTLYLSDHILPRVKKHIEYVAKNIDGIILKTKGGAS